VLHKWPPTSCRHWNTGTNEGKFNFNQKNVTI